MSTHTTLITGNTFPVKDALRAMGGRWDAANKGWRVPMDRASEALALIGGNSAPVRSTYAPAKSSSWRPCGYPGCSRSYCDECDGRGASSRGW